jgi:glucosyl-3-phosphoglycerate synthase
MDFAQERIETLHALADADRAPEAPTDRTAVLVPMTERDVGPEIDRVFGALEAVSPGRMVVALHADPGWVRAIETRLRSYDLRLELCWCNGPRIEALLADYGLDGPTGKGHDVWLGLGIALASESAFVAIHDADTASYTEAYVPRLVAPLADGWGKGRAREKANRRGRDRDRRTDGRETGAAVTNGGDDGNGSDDGGTVGTGSPDQPEGRQFVKGYHAWIEGNRLYGRLCRLLYAPLVRELAERHDEPILRYLDAVRYGLAGEYAMTANLARQVRVRRGWGLEVGLLGEAFRVSGSEEVCQVDLGVHDHDHRSVDGAAGLSAMARSVANVLLEAIEDGGVEPAYTDLPGRYRERAEGFVARYERDVAFNGLRYDAAAERRQVAAYAGAISPPEGSERLPAWSDCELPAAAVRAAARADLDGIERGVSREAPR